MRVTIPSTFDEEVIVTLMASGTKDATLEFTIFPKTSITQEIDLRSTYLSVSEEIGRTINFPLSITNMGEVDEIVDLIGIVPSGWSISFVTGTQMAVQSLSLASGQSEALTIKVVPSEDAVIGDYLVVINAVSEDSVLRDSLELEVNLREATSDVEIISTFTDVTVKAGENIEFPIAIWNKGETDALFLLTVLSVPENWKTVFTSEDIEISSVLVTAGESMTLRLKVTPPKAVKTGEYPIIVYTESDDGLITKQIDLRVSVGGSHEMELELSTLYKTLTIGDSVEFKAEVRNIGNSPITTIYLDTAVPGDWDATATPSQVSTLSPKESVTFTIVADTPADTVAGDYLITVQAMSDQTESEKIDLRVTAKASTAWGFIGIGLAGVAVIGLIIAFTRFKRR
ncbi:MAG: NEW3 domain-containing protein [Candidatus Bathyarchaeia archaeon]